jgi:hypothetical protein
MIFKGDKDPQQHTLLRLGSEAERSRIVGFYGM